MKIGITCPYSWDVPGGVQQHIRDLAEALIDQGHEVSVISPADDDTPLPPYVVGAGRAVPVPYNGSVARLSFGFLSVSRVRRWIKEGGFDVLHVHEPEIPSLSLLACWVAAGPIVATVHTAIPRSRVLLVTYPVVRTGLEKINGRIAVSEAARTTLVEHIGGDAVVIPNGVATRRYRKADPLPGWPGPGGAIGFLGRLDEPRKGLPVLLKAFEILGPQRPGLRLLIAGPAADAEEVLHRVPAGPARPGGAARAGQRGGQGPRAALGRRVLLAEHRRRVVRHRDRRGDGGRACPSWPATSTRSGRCCAAGRRASCSPPATPATWPARPAGCWTTRPGGPRCPPRRSPRWPTTTGRSSPAPCPASTRPSSSAAPRSPSPRRAVSSG